MYLWSQFAVFPMLAHKPDDGLAALPTLELSRRLWWKKVRGRKGANFHWMYFFDQPKDKDNDKDKINTNTNTNINTNTKTNKKTKSNTKSKTKTKTKTKTK